MADSLKLQVLKALTALLELTPDYTLGGKVFRGRSIYGDNDPDVMLSLLEAPQGSYTRAYAGYDQARSDLWVIYLQGFCQDDKENPSDPIYAMMDAVEKQLSKITARTTTGRAKYPEYDRLGGLVADFKFGPGVVRPPIENVSSKAFFYIPLQIGLASDVG